MKLFLTQDEKELMKIYKTNARRLTKKEEKRIERIERFLRMRGDLIIAAIVVFVAFAIFIIDARRRTMNIYEATKIAVKENKCITRTDDMWWNLKIKPTNGGDNCIIMGMDGSNPFGRWQPNIEDLLALDWVVTE